jgi:hypothetical protein
MTHPTMALPWQLEPASMSPTLSSPHASPILTSTPLPARRTFTRLTASTPCRTTTPCTPSVTSVAAPFPPLSPSSLEAGALHYPSPLSLRLDTPRTPPTLMTPGRMHPAPHRQGIHHPPLLLAPTTPPDDIGGDAPRLFNLRALNAYLRPQFLHTNLLHPVLPVHHLITALRPPQPLMDRPSRYE